MLRTCETELLESQGDCIEQVARRAKRLEESPQKKEPRAMAISIKDVNKLPALQGVGSRSLGLRHSNKVNAPAKEHSQSDEEANDLNLMSAPGLVLANVHTAPSPKDPSNERIAARPENGAGASTLVFVLQLAHIERARFAATNSVLREH